MRPIWPKRKSLVIDDSYADRLRGKMIIRGFKCGAYTVTPFEEDFSLKGQKECPECKEDCFVLTVISAPPGYLWASVGEYLDGV